MEYILGGTINDKEVLIVNKDGSLRGSDNFEEAEKLLPNMDEYHNRDYTWSASATIWWIQLQPKLFAFSSMEELSLYVENPKVKFTQGIAGSAHYVELIDNVKTKIIKSSKLIEHKDKKDVKDVNNS